MRLITSPQPRLRTCLIRPSRVRRVHEDLGQAVRTSEAALLGGDNAPEQALNVGGLREAWMWALCAVIDTFGTLAMFLPKAN